MVENPLISIIIPVFNREKLIVRTLKSVQNQTYSNWECIIVDDGSTDNTLGVIASLLDRDKRFQTISHRHAGNANILRNIGINKAKGEYIAMLDSDDFWDVNYLESRLANIKDNHLIYGGDRCIYENNITSTLSRDKIEEESPFYFVFYSKVPKQTSSIFFNKNIFGTVKFDERLTRHQDYDFLIQVLLNNYKCVCDNSVLVNINRKESRKTSFNFKGCYDFYKKYNKEFNENKKDSRRYFYNMFKRAVLQKNLKFSILYIFNYLKHFI